jgi:hypothetical protein
MQSLKAALLGYGRIGGSLPFHRHSRKQALQNNGSTFRIDIRIWASEPPEVCTTFIIHFYSSFIHLFKYRVNLSLILAGTSIDLFFW